MGKTKIGISIGDINGIGLEVILKTFFNKKIKTIGTPIIYGSSKVVSYHKNIIKKSDFQFQSINSPEKAWEEKVNVINCWEENANIKLGKINEIGGKYALKSLSAAVKDLKAGKIDALVTAPINKKAMELIDFGFSGHTEYLTHESNTTESLMLMVHENLRVGLVTNHLPIKDVAGAITKQKILKKLNIMQESLKIDFGLERPIIAVLALNPHAGDNGLLGSEEEEIIRPAIVEAKKKGLMVMGPFPADGFFGSGQFSKFDGILAMYHDQGLAPFKTLSEGKGVNFTAGLPYVRTSPTHGTGFDIVGKNLADPTSFRNSFFMAIDISESRKKYMESHKNPMDISKKTIEK